MSFNAYDICRELLWHHQWENANLTEFRDQVLPELIPLSFCKYTKSSISNIVCLVQCHRSLEDCQNIKLTLVHKLTLVLQY